MIRVRFPATGAALAVLALIACRDAPKVPLAPDDSLSGPLLSVDSLGEAPAPASIRNEYTRVSFYDGSHGGEASMGILTGMEYIGNRASMSTNYSMRGSVSRSSRIYNEHDALYDPSLWKRWAEQYYVPTGATCGFDMEAETEHGAWWSVWLRIFPNWTGSRVLKFSRDGPVRAPDCEEEAPPDDNSGGGGTGGWITIETCYYWAHYVNGVLVDIELRYCRYDQVPVADE